MKNLLLLMIMMSVVTSCTNGLDGAGKWPARTRDANVLIVDKLHYLSKNDIQAIHDVIWTEDPNLRVLSINSHFNRSRNQKVVLVTCSYQKGDRFTDTQGFELIRQGDTWKFGPVRGKIIAMPLSEHISPW
jgi:hypothetical protein